MVWLHSTAPVSGSSASTPMVGRARSTNTAFGVTAWGQSWTRYGGPMALYQTRLPDVSYAKTYAFFFGTGETVYENVLPANQGPKTALCFAIERPDCSS